MGADIPAAGRGDPASSGFPARRPATKSAACSATTTRAAGTAATAPSTDDPGRTARRPCSAGSTSATVARQPVQLGRLPLRRLRLPARRRPVQVRPARTPFSVHDVPRGWWGGRQGPSAHQQGRAGGRRTLGFAGRAGTAEVLTEASGWTGQAWPWGPGRGGALSCCRAPPAPCTTSTAEGPLQGRALRPGLQQRGVRCGQGWTAPEPPGRLAAGLRWCSWSSCHPNATQPLPAYARAQPPAAHQCGLQRDVAASR